MVRLTIRIAALLCSVWCVTLAAVELWPAPQPLQTSDQNGDGRADVWRRYDTRGQLVEIDRDTNFDGSPDIQEYYQRGALVRRESDRNFNGQTDVVEEFDPETPGQIRSVVDTDYDGTADLLVWSRDGRPVFSRQICPPDRQEPTKGNSAAERHDGDRLAVLIDPTESETSVRSFHLAPSDEKSVGLSTSGGLPYRRFTLLSPLTQSAPLAGTDAQRAALTIRFPHAPRAPPVSPLLLSLA